MNATHSKLFREEKMSLRSVTLSKVYEVGKKFVLENKRSHFKLPMRKAQKLLQNVDEIGDNGESIDDFAEEIAEAETGSQMRLNVLMGTTMMRVTMIANPCWNFLGR